MAIKKVTETILGKYKYREIRAAYGPAAIGVANSSEQLYIKDWLVALKVSGDVDLWQENAAGDGYEYVLTLDTISVSAASISLAFDQAARPVISYEIGGVIYVRNSGGVVGGISGRTPQLLQEPLVAGDSVNTDIALIYMSTDLQNILYRSQGDSYATEHVLFDSLPVTNNYYLLQIVLLSRRYELILGSPDNDGALAYTYLISDLYALREAEHYGVDTDIVAAEAKSMIVPINLVQPYGVDTDIVGGLVSPTIMDVEVAPDVYGVDTDIIAGKAWHSINTIDDVGTVEVYGVDTDVIAGLVWHSTVNTEDNNVDAYGVDTDIIAGAVNVV